jgi:hypothetical protein
MEPPMPLNTHGQDVHVVSGMDVTIKDTPGYEVIRKLESFLRMESAFKQGDKVKATAALVSNVGDVVLMNDNPLQLHLDLQVFRALEKGERKLTIHFDGRYWSPE